MRWIIFRLLFIRDVRDIVHEFFNGGIEARLIRCRRYPDWLTTGEREYRLILSQRVKPGEWKKFAEIDIKHFAAVRELMKESEKWVHGV